MEEEEEKVEDKRSNRSRCERLRKGCCCVLPLY